MEEENNIENKTRCIYEYLQLKVIVNSLNYLQTLQMTPDGKSFLVKSCFLLGPFQSWVAVFWPK